MGFETHPLRILNDRSWCVSVLCHTRSLVAMGISCEADQINELAGKSTAESMVNTSPKMVEVSSEMSSPILGIYTFIG